jgi:hypothetical protein
MCPGYVRWVCSAHHLLREARTSPGRETLQSPQGGTAVSLSGRSRVSRVAPDALDDEPLICPALRRHIDLDGIAPAAFSSRRRWLLRFLAGAEDGFVRRHPKHPQWERFRNALWRRVRERSDGSLPSAASTQIWAIFDFVRQIAMAWELLCRWNVEERVLAGLPSTPGGRTPKQARPRRPSNPTALDIAADMGSAIERGLVERLLETGTTRFEESPGRGRRAQPSLVHPADMLITYFADITGNERDGASLAADVYWWFLTGNRVNPETLRRERRRRREDDERDRDFSS